VVTLPWADTDTAQASAARSTAGRNRGTGRLALGALGLLWVVVILSLAG